MSGNLIAHEWRASQSGRTFTKHDPADARSELGTYARSDATDVDAAVRAARAAGPAWQAVPAPLRGAILFRFAELLATAKEDLARTVTFEMGKVIEESRGDVQVSVHFGDRQREVVREYYADSFKRGHCPPGLAKKHNGCMPPGQARKWQLGRPLPRDVVAYDLPPRVVVSLGVPPAGHKYVRVAGDILMIAIGTRIVVDAIDDLGGM